MAWGWENACLLEEASSPPPSISPIQSGNNLIAPPPNDGHSFRQTFSPRFWPSSGLDLQLLLGNSHPIRVGQRQTQVR